MDTGDDASSSETENSGESTERKGARVNEDESADAAKSSYEDESAMTADVPAIPDAAPLAADELFEFGTPSPNEEPERLRHEGHHKILGRAGNDSLLYYPEHMEADYYEWATVPRPVFAKTPLPEGHEVLVHRGGTRWCYRRSPAEAWREGGKGTLTSDGRRRFMVLGNQIYAAVLVCSAFWGERPGPEHGIYEAGHAHAVAAGVVPREAAHQLSWLTKEQNGADSRRAGVIAMTGQQQAIWARPPDKAPAEVHAAFAALGLALVQRDGHAWARFDSQHAAAETLGPDQTNISKVLRGARKQTGNYTFDWVAVDEPAERDRVQVTATQKGATFVTRDGQLLQRKTLADDTIVWTAFTLTPSDGGYVRVTTTYTHLPEQQQLHRIVFRAFANDCIEDKIERTRVRNAEIDDDLRALSLSAEERAELESEKNGLAYKDFEIDHINGIKTDNRLVNLEILTTLEHVVKTRGVPVVETASAERSSAELAAFVTITKAARSGGVPRWDMSRGLKTGNGYAAFNGKDGTTRHFHKG